MQAIAVASVASNPGNSFGITSTPGLGWACCNTPPCVCCGKPVYFSDNHKTWGGTGEFSNKCCGLCGWTVANAKTSPNGNPYDYDFSPPGCCSDGTLTVTRAGGEVGRIIAHTYCCNCDKIMLNAVDTQGKSMWTLRTPPCVCCPESQGCCGGSCCSCWGRSDSLWLSPGDGKPREPYVISAAWQFHRCCPGWYPWWFGYDAPPNVSEDERAILLGFLMIHGYSLHYRFQQPRVSAYPFTFGNVK